MKKKLKIEKGTVIAAFIASVWVCVTLYLLGLLQYSSTWPAFIPFVLFTVGGWKTNQLKNIFTGSISGILLGAIALKSINYLVGGTGIYYMYMVPVFVIVFLLISLGEVLPMIFNNYAFCYYTIAFASQKQETFEWMQVSLLGGIFFTGGLILFFRIFLNGGPIDQSVEKPVEKLVENPE
ncbi:MAG: hypothetical protein CVU84_01395 [Firmicutes bacterium HGW-Firmicutes-1]|jgi:hypothetical protein|nr:MAG: hypothetical protein CVU84_01395 [Firmicutes bacterium HGW-Firmicutes-1]